MNNYKSSENKDNANKCISSIINKNEISQKNISKNQFIDDVIANVNSTDQINDENSQKAIFKNIQRKNTKNELFHNEKIMHKQTHDRTKNCHLNPNARKKKSSMISKNQSFSIPLIDSSFIISKKSLFRAKNTIVLVGAGLSTSSSIPDFRSENGMFSQIRSTHKVKGHDVFTQHFSLDPETRPIYMDVIGNLKESILTSNISTNHSFLHHFKNQSKTFRIYTQNIDSFEEKAGLSVFDLNQKIQKKASGDIVYLHGNLNLLSCSYCGNKELFDQDKVCKWKNKEEIECNSCILRIIKHKNLYGTIKESKPRMKSTVGFLNTQIIHYHQPHPSSHEIARIFNLDVKACNLFIVIGTSLRVHGIKSMVRMASKICRNNGGFVLLVNRERIEKNMESFFDGMWMGDIEDFCACVSDVLGFKENMMKIVDMKENVVQKCDSSIRKIKQDIDINNKRDYLSSSQIQPMNIKNGTKIIEKSPTRKLSLTNFISVRNKPVNKQSEKEIIINPEIDPKKLDSIRKRLDELAKPKRYSEILPIRKKSVGNKTFDVINSSFADDLHKTNMKNNQKEIVCEDVKFSELKYELDSPVNSNAVDRNKTIQNEKIIDQSLEDKQKPAENSSNANDVALQQISCFLAGEEKNAVQSNKEVEPIIINQQIQEICDTSTTKIKKLSCIQIKKKSLSQAESNIITTLNEEKNEKEMCLTPKKKVIKTDKKKTKKKKKYY